MSSFTIIDNFVLTQIYMIKKRIFGKNGRIKKLQKLGVPLWLVKNIRKVKRLIVPNIFVVV